MRDHLTGAQPVGMVPANGDDRRGSWAEVTIVALIDGRRERRGRGVTRFGEQLQSSRAQTAKRRGRPPGGPSALDPGHRPRGACRRSPRRARRLTQRWLSGPPTIVLADAAGEHQRVEPAERGDAAADRASRAGGRRRRRRAARRCRPHRTRSSTSRMSASPHRPSSPLSCSSTCAEVVAVVGVLRSHSTAPGSSAPERVAITRPSSGREAHRGHDAAAVEHRAERRAATEVRDDDPACVRRDARATRRADQACERPWNP